jgi:hypothetical protein
MPNKDLKDLVWVVPKNILVKINNTLKNYNGDGNVSGVKRAKNILNNNSISYSEMKRLKNFFENCDENSFEFNVIGGGEMKVWVNNSLSTSRDAIYNEKNTRMMSGEENQFIKPHEKDKINHKKNDKRTSITKLNIPKIYKQSSGKDIMLNNSFTEEVNRIKQIMEFFQKK